MQIAARLLSRFTRPAGNYRVILSSLNDANPLSRSSTNWSFLCHQHRPFLYFSSHNFSNISKNQEQIDLQLVYDESQSVPSDNSDKFEADSPDKFTRDADRYEDTYESALVAIQRSEDPASRYLLGYTCKICQHRSFKNISKIAYEKGIVIVLCKKCRNKHLIVDHLDWFKHAK